MGSIRQEPAPTLRTDSAQVAQQVRSSDGLTRVIATSPTRATTVLPGTTTIPTQHRSKQFQSNRPTTLPKVLFRPICQSFDVLIRLERLQARFRSDVSDPTNEQPGLIRDPADDPTDNPIQKTDPFRSKSIALIRSKLLLTVSDLSDRDQQQPSPTAAAAVSSRSEQQPSLIGHRQTTRPAVAAKVTTERQQRRQYIRSNSTQHQPNQVSRQQSRPAAAAPTDQAAKSTSNCSSNSTDGPATAALTDHQQS